MSEEKEKISSRYDFWTPFYDAVDNFPLFSRYQRGWKKKAVKHLHASDGDRILDVGTGTGQLLPWISKEFEKGSVIGSDISEKMVEKARTKVDGTDDLKIEVVQDDIEDSSFPSDHFDKIIATFAFTTFPNVDKAASECARILKPDGKMIVLDTGKPEKTHANILFYPMMVSAKIFGRTHMDREIKKELSEYFEVKTLEKNMLGMVYTLKCKLRSD
ncbi:MAG: methyltransferase domain-containing protein [Candidatus Thermoplasmatota archaeon]|nr:methyltransferase domain-containing protein [Candidatus Thermoplasmatota archaeon]